MANVKFGSCTEEIESQSAPEEVIPDLDAEDWYSKLLPDEIATSADGKPCPRLVGLRRLAKPYIKHESVYVNKLDVVRREIRRKLKRFEVVDGKEVLVGVEEVIGNDYLPYASVAFEVNLHDGRTFSDAADAWAGNCDELGHFPTAVATARAEGRVLRKVLGIKEHVYEELSSKNAIEELTSPEDSPIAPEQKKMIESLLNKAENTTLKEVLEKVSAEATNLNELTASQAIGVIKYLNEKKKKSKK